MTPTAHDASERDASKTSVVKRDNPLLETQALFFPTPLTHDATEAVCVSRMARHELHLPSLTKLFPTPVARSWKDTASTSEMARHEPALPALSKLFPEKGEYVNPGDKCIAIAEERMRKAGVTGVESFFPTPTTIGMRGGAHSWQKLKKLRDLGYITPEEMSAMASTTGGKLNPMWVEWLMGWPIGWTGLKPLETVKYLR